MHRIHLGLLCGALVLFFLPWTNVQCSGRLMATQSGVQATYGSLSLSEDMQAMVDKNAKKTGPEQSKDGIGLAILVGLALLAVLAGVVVGAIMVFKGTTLAVQPGVLALGALALLLIQAGVGFPINHAIAKSRADTAAQKDDMASAIGAAMPFSAERTAWFYIELITLAIPAGIYINSKLPNRPAAVESSRV